MRAEAIARLLPEVFQRTIERGIVTPTSAILAVMEQLHAPSEEILLNLSDVLNPRSAPDRFLPYLSRWANLSWLFEPILEDWAQNQRRPVRFPAGLGAMRELIALSFRLNRESGTARGLLLFLRTVTGIGGFTIEEQPLDSAGAPLPYHIRVYAPQAALPYRAMLERIIEHEKPAFVTYELIFRDAPPENLVEPAAEGETANAG